MLSKITYQSGMMIPEEPVTVAIGRRGTGRQEGDMCISRDLAIDCPLRLAALVRADGSVDEWYAEFRNTDNTYWHLDHGSDDAAAGKYGLPKKTLTQPQRETLIRVWGGAVRPFGVRGTCGASVMAWVAAGHEEIERVLGRVPPLTAPCNDREDLIPAGEQADEDAREGARGADDTAARESYLEQAAEEGQIGGAAAAD